MAHEIPTHINLTGNDGPIGCPERRKSGGALRLLAAFAGFCFVPLAFESQDALWFAFAGQPRPAWVAPARIVLAFAPALLAMVIIARRIATRRRSTWLAFGVSSLLVWAVAAALVISPFGRFALESSITQRAFDPGVWEAAGHPEIHAQPHARSEARVHMIDDLMAARLLDRLSRDTVRELLGPDDSAAGTGFGAGYFQAWDAVYWLGRERGFIRIDSEWLVIRFNKEGGVAAYRIVND